jgi:hypothetical protein
MEFSKSIIQAFSELKFYKKNIEFFQEKNIELTSKIDNLRKLRNKAASPQELYQIDVKIYAGQEKLDDLKVKVDFLEKNIKQNQKIVTNDISNHLTNDAKDNLLKDTVSNLKKLKDLSYYENLKSALSYKNELLEVEKNLLKIQEILSRPKEFVHAKSIKDILDKIALTAKIIALYEKPRSRNTIKEILQSNQSTQGIVKIAESLRSILKKGLDTKSVKKEKSITINIK